MKEYKFTCNQCGHEEAISEAQLRAIIAENKERGVPVVNKIAGSFHQDADGSLYVRRTAEDAEC